MSALSVVVTGVFLLAMIGALVGAAIELRAMRRLRREGHTTVGRVTSITADLVNEGWSARIEYVVAGSPYVRQVRSGGEHQVGQEVQLRYLPSDPASAIREVPGMVWRRSLTGVVAAAFFLVGALTFGILGALGFL